MQEEEGAFGEGAVVIERAEAVVVDWAAKAEVEGVGVGVVVGVRAVVVGALG